MNVRVVFDNCSQKSFVKDELCKQLKLKPSRFEYLTVKAFGSTEEKVQKLPVVNIKIKSVCGKHERVIEA